MIPDNKEAIKGWLLGSPQKDSGSNLEMLPVTKSGQIEHWEKNCNGLKPVNRFKFIMISKRKSNWSLRELKENQFIILTTG